MLERLIAIMSGILPLLMLGLVVFAMIELRERPKKPRRKQLCDELAFLCRRLGSPGNAFRPDPALKRAIARRERIEDNLKTLMGDIVAHMGLPRENIELFVVYSTFDSFRQGGHIGRFQRTSYQNREIEIILRHDHKFHHIAAILCHECAHFFMDARGVHARNQQDEELLTDLMTIFLGFSRVMLKGYATRQKTESAGYNRQVTYSTRIGYLTEGELRYAKGALRRTARRQEKTAKAQKEKAAEQARIREKKEADRKAERQRLLEQQRILQEKLAVLESLHLGMRSLLETAKERSASYSPEEWQTMQEILLANESGDLSRELDSRQKKAGALLTEDAIAAETAAVDALCAKLCEWNTLLGRQTAQV